MTEPTPPTNGPQLKIIPKPTQLPRLMDCPSCKTHVSRAAHFCPTCGEPFRSGNALRSRASGIGVGGVMFGVFLGGFVLPGILIAAWIFLGLGGVF